MNNTFSILFLLVAWALTLGASADVQLDAHSDEVLKLPELSEGQPAAGKRFAVTPPEYIGTEVFHTLYLPKDWNPDGPAVPIVFEYTGNFFPESGSTGEVEDAALGYGLSGGRYIWVSLPYISKDHRTNEATWWGDTAATVQYAKRNVPLVIKQYNADPNVVFLCGFSRGAIGVNYLGLHDDEAATLWTAFIAHDHFDGVQAWAGTTWGFPLETYRAEALKRLKRVNGRPYLVSHDGSTYGTKEYLKDVVPDIANFTFSYVDTAKALGPFPNEFAKTAHNDRWAYRPSEYRTLTRKWMNDVVRSQSSN
jgi:hypothetical protein